MNWCIACGPMFDGGHMEACPLATGGAGRQNPRGMIHVVSDHDNIGETKTWCGQEFVAVTETLAEATCILCLKAITIYGGGAATRLAALSHLESPVRDEK